MNAEAVSLKSGDAHVAPADAPSVQGTGEAFPLPRWFEQGLVVVASGAVCFGAVGLLTADLGSYQPVPVLALASAATIAVGVLAWPRRTRAAAGLRGASRPAVCMCLIALVFLGWNSVYSSQHVVIGRDPGVYTVAGKWIAAHGNLEMKTGSDWTSKTSDATVISPGTYIVTNDEVQFQFAHLESVYFAEADNLGGDRLMFRVPALLSALALCALYAVGCRLVKRPWLVLAAVGALALSLPQINVARETLSESSTELLIWAGMYLLLLAYDRRSARIGLLAGATLGSTVMAHIDAPIYLIPLPVLGAICILANREAPDRRRVMNVAAAVVIGVVPVAAIGTFDLTRRAGHYYKDLHHDVGRLHLGFAASAVFGFLLLVLWPVLGPRLQGPRAWWSSRRRPLALVSGFSATGLLLAVWALRPDFHAYAPNTPAAKGFTASLQRASGAPIEPSRTYAEQTLTWFTWYLGPVCVGLAAVGLGLLLSRVVRGRAATETVVLAVAGIGTAVYLWNPSITPDQIWAARRFVPVGMPLAVLLAASALSVLGTAARRAGTRPRESLLLQAVGVVGLLAFPLATTGPIRGFEPDHGYLDAVDATCRAVGPRAAVVVAANDPQMQELVPAFRAWCSVPAATFLQVPTAPQLLALDAGWAGEGRRLWVVGSDPRVVAVSDGGRPGSLLGASPPGRALDMVIGEPPPGYTPSLLEIYGGRPPR